VAKEFRRKAASQMVRESLMWRLAAAASGQSELLETRKLSSIQDRGLTDRVLNWDPNPNPYPNRNLDLWTRPSIQENAMVMTHTLAKGQG